jgi:hypothetical protein
MGSCRSAIAGEAIAAMAIAAVVAGCEGPRDVPRDARAIEDASRGDATAIDAPATIDAAPAIDSGAADPGPPARVRRVSSGEGAEVALALAVDATGRAFVAGAFRGAIAFGALTALGAGTVNGFLAAIDPDGAAVWLDPLTTTGFAEIRSVATIATSGEIVAVGQATSVATFAGVSHAAGSGQDAIVSVRSRDGALRWWHAYGADGNTQAHDVVWDSVAARLFVVGVYYASAVDADFAGTPLPRNRSDDGYAVAVDAAGIVQWARQHRASGNAITAAVDARDGRVCVAGLFANNLDLGADGSVDLVASGGVDGFVASLGADGSPRWSRAVGATAADWMAAVAVVGDDCLVLGRVDAAIDPYRTGRVLLARYGASSSDPIFAVRYDGELTQAPAALVVDAEGSAYVSGSFGQPAWRPIAGGPEVIGAGGRDGFVAKHDARGALVWMRNFGGAADDAVDALALGPAGELVAALTLRGDAVIDGAAIDVRGASDVAVITLGP